MADSTQNPPINTNDPNNPNPNPIPAPQPCNDEQIPAEEEGELK